MADRIAHRGPDDSGLWQSADGSIALAHRRLSIIDLSPLGRNPMSWDGGRLWITFNGEIYNFLELRRELEAAGHRFRSQTEPCRSGWATFQWGTDSIRRLVGMFASLSGREPPTTLAGPRSEGRNLCITHTRWPFRFASELKAFWSTTRFGEIDIDAIGLYLRYGYVPSPTAFKDARKLPPAHYLLCESGGSPSLVTDPLRLRRRSSLTDPRAGRAQERLAVAEAAVDLR
jgi:asparagine synthase (glutamine-hydrolysing)